MNADKKLSFSYKLEQNKKNITCLFETEIWIGFGKLKRIESNKEGLILHFVEFSKRKFK